MLMWKCLVLKAYIRKGKRLKSNDLRLHAKKRERNSKLNPRKAVGKKFFSIHFMKPA